MLGDIYPTKYLRNTTDMFGRMKLRLPQDLSFSAKIYAASRESKIELLMLVSDFMVNSRLKNTLWYLEFMECLNKDV